MKKWFLLLSIFLAGCTATQIQYSPNMIKNKDLAVQIIEQVVMEQPLKFRPESVFVTDSYLAFGDGVSGKETTLSNDQSFGSSSSISLSSSKVNAKNITSRFYFNSMAELELFKKRDWYVIQLKNDEHRVVKRFYTRSLKKAESLIDSISFFASRAKPFGAS
ncbi:sensor protein [Moritella sp. 24]|uniref:hypothetical protein n=1 Tax=Moritella sp. 24 TaxID=2746230 RepID=UPI001BAD461B|nr:hypothetical protein [Moritella sp. 24]QUM76714.1 sensor protein [Moritella sp. 24]